MTWSDQAKTCDRCSEPATRDFFTMQGRTLETTSRSLCYLHAVEDEMLDLPMEQIAAVAAETGHSRNAVIFVLEALFRSPGQLNPRGCCEAVQRSAREHFAAAAEEVLRYWRLGRSGELGRLVEGLFRQQLLGSGRSYVPGDYTDLYDLTDLPET